MKTRYKLIFVVGIFIGVLLMIQIISQLSSALEPKLLWKKEIPSEIKGMSFARKSGDVIFVHEYEGNRNRITILNKDGQSVWQWGPSLEESIKSVEISEDGRVFVYNSGKDIIYYCQRDGKELWKLNNHKDPTLSPDGRYLILSPPMGWHGEGWFLDSQGKILRKSLKLAFSEGPVFSPDGNYFAEMPYIFDISGNSWEIPHGYYNSLSENGEFIGIEESGEEEEDGIYDRDGNLVFGGKNLISGNGKIVARFGATKTEVFKFPEKLKLKEYPIERADINEGYWAFGHEAYSRISLDGRYIAVFGRRTDKESSENVFVIDINENKFWSEIIPEAEEEGTTGLFLTNGGRYLLVGNVTNLTTFYFYKIY